MNIKFQRPNILTTWLLPKNKNVSNVCITYCICYCFHIANNQLYNEKSHFKCKILKVTREKRVE